MKAKLLELKGKYYGTEMEIEHNGQSIWIEFASKGLTASTTNWKPSIREDLDEDEICDSHYETQGTYDMAMAIIEKLNN